MKSKKEKDNFSEVIILFSTMMTIISLVWIFTKPITDLFSNPFLKAFFILLFGFGGFGIALPIIDKAKEVFKKLREKNERK